MADMTREGMPTCCSITLWTARALMTVPSMPMKSAVERSTPAAASVLPRMMLPPPITRPSSTPMRWTAAQSSASWRSTLRSCPNSRSPSSASPDIFNRTRRNRASDSALALIGWAPPRASWAKVVGRSSDARQLRHLRREVVATLVDALAKHHPNERHDLQRSTQLLAGGLHRLLHALVGVDHEHLLEQHGLLVELADAALDHLPDDVLGLAGRACLLGVDGTFPLDHGRVELMYAHRLRAGRGHVHRELLADLGHGRPVPGRGQRHQHTQLAQARSQLVMQVAGHRTLF